ncbi:ribosome small subunit-dependent GTPase A [Bacteroidota bacterium]
MDLKSLGWDESFDKSFEPFKEKGFDVGRISAENKNNYLVLTRHGEVYGEITGKLLFTSDDSSTLPKVGDWAAIQFYDDNELAIIHDVLPRRTKLSRKVSDKRTSEQVIAANIDVVFIINSLDERFNINSIERYLVTAYQSGAEPVIVLSKSDLCDDVEKKLTQVRKISGDAEVLPISSIEHKGVDEVKKFLRYGETVVFVGASGAGKSTLINALLGKELQAVKEVRSGDSKGKHTTTRRELIIFPEGGLLIDTPGLRELALWSADNGFAAAFSEIELLGERCRYADCTHTHEVNCAVKTAVEAGQIPEEQYNNYLKLKKELDYLEKRQDVNAAQEEKRKWRSIHKEMRHFNKKNK